MPTPAPHPVLLVEDDPMIAKTLAMSLRYRGFELTVASTLQQAEEELAARRFALLLLDVGLPDGSGIELCRRVRERDAALPILMLTARTEEATAVQSLAGGADDYVRKPYGLQELTARMQRLVERAALRPARQTLAFGPVAIDPQKHEAQAQGQPLKLGKREFALLKLLVAAGGDVVTRERMLDALDCDADIYDRTLDSHLSHLRRKLKDAGAGLRIAAVYGVGYRLETPS
jgi:DNA-binding response OmpR family regulator